ncbi:hypothetical protein OH77DRAFT_1513930 [Trametes cingulata]|nr:hypothetical protein OH77DRAFT_1513930 [Trametes cingulata]
MEEPSRKRARDDADAEVATGGSGSNGSDAPGSAPLIPTAILEVMADSDFWFEDGNIILVSQGITFRVYKGLLAEHSAVFKSMFQIAQGKQAAADQAHGCPVVTLDDSPHDLRELFRLIFPLNSSLKLDKAGYIDIDMLSAIVRLDHKYELPALCAQAIGYLTTYYTSDFDAWTSGQNAIQWKPKPVHAIAAISLARLTNTSSILPTAFYICANLDPSELLRGYTRRDGTTERLSDSDLETCLQFRDRLIQANVHSGLVLFKPSIRCSPGEFTPGGPYCSKFLRGVMERSSSHGLPSIRHPLASPMVLESWIVNPEACIADADVMRELGLGRPATAWCKGCRSYFQEHDLAVRRAAWRSLPEQIGVVVKNWETANA